MRTRVPRCFWWRIDTIARSVSPATAESGTCSCSSSRSLTGCSGPTPTVCTGMPVAASRASCASLSVPPVSAPSLTSTIGGHRHAGGHLRHRGPVHRRCAWRPRRRAAASSDSTDCARSENENSRSSELAPICFSAPASCSAVTACSRRDRRFAIGPRSCCRNRRSARRPRSRDRGSRSTFSTGRHSSTSTSARNANCSSADHAALHDIPAGAGAAA